MKKKKKISLLLPRTRFSLIWIWAVQTPVSAAANTGKSYTYLTHICHRANSKNALTKDLIEGLEKDLEKLKRFEENIKVRKTLSMKGGQAILDETEEDRERMLTEAIQKDVQKEGAHIIHADQKRLQLFRHKPGQLDSLKDLNLDELEELRIS